MSKLVSLSKAKSLVSTLQNENKTVVFTNGCFDILHAGHVTYLEQAKALGDFLILGLNSDASVQRLKGKNRPINNQNNRAIVLSGLSAIDLIVIFDEDTPIALIRELQPDIHVKGGDYKKEELPEYDVIQSYGGSVRILSFVEGESTTNTIQKISNTPC